MVVTVIMESVTVHLVMEGVVVKLVSYAVCVLMPYIRMYMSV